MSDPSYTPATDPWDVMIEVPLGLLLDLATAEEHTIRTLLRLIAHFFAAPDSAGMTLPELADACGLNAGRTERALAAHQQGGWVQESAGVYSLAVDLPGMPGAAEERGDGPPQGTP
jgi:hypothetical protein